MPDDQGMQWLVDGVDQIVLGDQHHAEAIDALRQAQGKSWVLIVEKPSDEPDKDFNVGCYTSISEAGDGHAIFRVARVLHNIAARYFEIASQTRLSFLAGQLFGSSEDEDESA